MGFTTMLARIKGVGRWVLNRWKQLGCEHHYCRKPGQEQGIKLDWGTNCWIVRLQCKWCGHEFDTYEDVEEVT